MACNGYPTVQVADLSEYLSTVGAVAADWDPVFPWFRGEPGDTTTPLVPEVFRAPSPGYHYDENNLLQTFRRRAHLLGLPIVPQRHETDQWIFLARHVGLPTRLLDWSEGALIGLYFALLSDNPVVWMLNPYDLNARSVDDAKPNAFGLTWFTPDDGRTNVASANINAAWQLNKGELQFPAAVEPTNIHPRMNAQHSYFTVHGSDRRPLCEQIGTDCLKRFSIEFEDPDAAIRELRMLGVAHSTIMPDAPALAQELKRFLVVEN